MGVGHEGEGPKTGGSPKGRPHLKGTLPPPKKNNNNKK